MFSNSYCTHCCEDTRLYTSTGQYLMMVCRPLTCGVLSNTLSVWGSGWVCWADARSALRPRTGCSDQKVFLLCYSATLSEERSGLASRQQRVIIKIKSLTTERRTRESVTAQSVQSTETRSPVTKSEPKSQKAKSKYVSAYLTLSSRCKERG